MRPHEIMHLSDIRDDDSYKIKTLGLTIRGKDLKHPGIRKAINEELLRRKEEIENERRFYLNIGETPVLKFKIRPPVYLIRSSFHGLRDLLLELDMPEDPRHVYCSIHLKRSNLLQDKERTHDKFPKYDMEFFGLFLKLPNVTSYNLMDWFLSERPQYKSQPRYWSSQAGHIVQIWRVRLFYCSMMDVPTSLSNPISPSNLGLGYLEERWHPQNGRKLALSGLEHLLDSEILPFMEFAKDALNMVGKTLVKKTNRGRPAEYTSREEFVSDYVAAYINLLTKAGCEPKQPAVAAELLIGNTTFKDTRRRFGVPWPPI